MNYQLVSVPTILRDYIDVNYKDDDHKMLVDIADGLYNAGVQVADMLPGAQVAYYKQTPEFWRLVLEDASAIDGQLTSDAKRDDLIADYADMLEA